MVTGQYLSPWSIGPASKREEQGSTTARGSRARRDQDTRHLFSRSLWRKLSASRLIANTVRKRATAGMTRSIGSLLMKLSAPEIRLPQLGWGIWMPRPRKLSAASATIAPPTLNIAKAKSGGKTFGMM